MPGFSLWENAVAADVGPDQIDPQLLANSQNIYSGDPVVWTSVTGSQYRVRLLSQDDIDDLYVNSSTAGILGFMPADVSTDSSGNWAAVPSPVSLFSNVKPIYNVPSIAGFEPVDPVTGRMKASIYSVANWMAGSLWETTAVTESLIGTAVGLLISTLSGGAATFFWSTAATTKIGRIVQVDVQNPLFNVAGTANVSNTTHNPRCPVVVKLYAAYDQFATNVSYDD